jgi:hypothetical protein
MEILEQRAGCTTDQKAEHLWVPSCVTVCCELNLDKTGNVNCGAFTKPLLSWKSNNYLHTSVCVRACVCGWRCTVASVCLRGYNLTNQHATRRLSAICSLWFHRLFPCYLTNGTNFGKTFLEIKCVFWLSLQLLPKTFLNLRKIQPHTVTNVNTSSCKAPAILIGF